MTNIYVETYGCSANKFDSEIMIGILEKFGYTISGLKDADYLLINTCGVKQPTEEKIIHRLKQLSNINKKIIVAGCLPKINLNRIRKTVPNFSAILDTNSIHKIDEIVKNIENGKSNIIYFSDKPEQKPILPKHSFNQVISIISISEGCLSSCSYCCTKFSRGSLISYKPSLIFEAVKHSINNGHKEIWITSQDNSCYGKDINTNLVELLNEICKIEGKYFIRIGMMNPSYLKDFLDDLIEIYKNEKIFKFLHLPVQSGSNKILKLMRRGYKVKDFLYCVKKFRKEIPKLTVSTDIIVGFPKENNSDFKKTIQLIEKIKPDIVNISKFGARPGTLALQMEQLDHKIINKRSSVLHKLVKEIQLKNNEKWLGWKGEILIDEKGCKGNVIGRNSYYKPIVTKGKIGTFKTIEIIDIHPTYLIGN